MANSPAAARLLVCNCQRTMDIDAAVLAKALGRSEPPVVHRELCRAETAAFTAALAGDAMVHVACTQEAPLFRELATEAGADEARLRFTNIREKAGWCEARGEATAKMAALLAEAVVVSQPAGTMTLASTGQCLVYGRGQVAMDAAIELSGRLSVTLLLADAEDVMPPATITVPIFKGRIRRLSGHLGRFEVEVDGYAAMLPSSRRTLEFALPRNGARSTCDLVLDLSGGPALVTDPGRRDGYLHVDPRAPVAVAKALLTATDLVGEFEKPLYISFDAGICAHTRSGKAGCRNCLDVCPTGAITPAGDHVAIDPAICGGCGNCAAVCPTGAATYALPRREDELARSQALVRTYLSTGGRKPVVLVHDERHGAETISAMARLGRGLPSNVLPLSLGSVLQFGHDLLLGLVASGAGHVVVLCPPEKPDERESLETQADLARAFLDGLGYGGARLVIVAERDPDVVEAALYAVAGAQVAPVKTAPLPVKGTKRDIARAVLARLGEAAPKPQTVLALPKGAPYGRIRIDTGACTLCLACVGACPANALADHPDRPEVSLTEAACVQCGICVATCPETAITLEPRYDFTPAAMTPAVLYGEEPFCCVECGKAFGTKATISRVVERLKGHAMFKDERQLRLIQMCDNCRVVVQTQGGNDPFKAADRPRIRTTEDYVAAEAEAKLTGRKPEDFLS